MQCRDDNSETTKSIDMGQTRMNREFTELAIGHIVTGKAQYVQSVEHLRFKIYILDSFHDVL